MISLIDFPPAASEALLRLALLAGMGFHKLVWERLKRGRAAGKVAPGAAIHGFKKLVKWVKTLALAGLVVQTALLNVLPLSRQPLLVRGVGMVIFLGGLALAVAGRLQLGKNWADLEDYQVLAGQAVVQKGVYRYIRHPIYTGDVLLVSGLELALNSWLVVGAALLALFVYRQARAEERLLAENLPDYQAYQKHTRMFIPGIF